MVGEMKGGGGRKKLFVRESGQIWSRGRKKRRSVPREEGGEDEGRMVKMREGWEGKEGGRGGEDGGGKERKIGDEGEGREKAKRKKTRRMWEGRMCRVENIGEVKRGEEEEGVGCEVVDGGLKIGGGKETETMDERKNRRWEEWRCEEFNEEENVKMLERSGGRGTKRWEGEGEGRGGREARRGGEVHGIEGGPQRVGGKGGGKRKGWKGGWVRRRERVGEGRRGRWWGEEDGEDGRGWGEDGRRDEATGEKTKAEMRACRKKREGGRRAGTGRKGREWARKERNEGKRRCRGEREGEGVKKKMMGIRRRRGEGVGGERKMRERKRKMVGAGERGKEWDKMGRRGGAARGEEVEGREDRGRGQRSRRGRGKGGSGTGRRTECREEKMGVRSGRKGREMGRWEDGNGSTATEEERGRWERGRGKGGRGKEGGHILRRDEGVTGRKWTKEREGGRVLGND
ncbi:hypothetical protein Tco_0291389 [Tanacetum coccineum]